MGAEGRMQLFALRLIGVALCLTLAGLTGAAETETRFVKITGKSVNIRTDYSTVSTIVTQAFQNYSKVPRMLSIKSSRAVDEHSS